MRVVAKKFCTMASNAYPFITHWRLKTVLQEVVEVISDAESLPRWWPSIYLEVRQLTPGAEQGVGNEDRKVWL